LHGTKVRKKVDISVILQHFLIPAESLTVVSSPHLIDYQQLTKKLQLQAEKKHKKGNNVLKKYLPLQRFNKQMIVLQI
jgi:hypothetical protein